MPRGAKPGERRGGRIAGIPNKVTAELKIYAGQYTREAVDALVKILRKGKSEQARVAAANALMDRAVGKPAQALTGEGGEGPIATTIRHIYETLQAEPPPP